MNHSKRKLTPIQALICEKQRLMKQCDRQEQLIGEHLNYIHQNAGSLIVKGVKSILFPATLPDKSVLCHSEGNNFNSYLTQIKCYMPILWSAVRPVLIDWGINKIEQKLKTFLKKH